MRATIRTFSCLLLWTVLLPLIAAPSGEVYAQNAPAQDSVTVSESDYYYLESIPIPEEIILEVTGLVTMPDGRLAVATRHGDIWLVDNVAGEGSRAPRYRRFAKGLHHPGGLAFTDGVFYTVTWGQLTRIIDTDGDEKADRYEKIAQWPMSGNHHAFSYGPKVLPDGRLWVMFNLDSPDRGMNRYSAVVPWRGVSATYTPDGDFHPIAAGLKAPSGFGTTADGEMFYAENDGPWIASGWITHVEQGAFMGHPAPLRWKDLPDFPVDTKYDHTDIPDTGQPMHMFAEKMPALKLPSVWFPTGPMGSATLDIVPDTTGGKFGPFDEQLFVSDQGHNMLMRVYLEEIKGTYQGAVFHFWEEFSTGVFRHVWAPDGSLIIGGTTRGWPNPGKSFDLQRLTWKGKVPLEMETVQVEPDGFTITFTRPVAREILRSPENYTCSNFTYRYDSNYGSPIINEESCPVKGVAPAEDGRSVRIVLDNMRRHYIHRLTLDNIRTPSGVPLLHNTAFYTLHNWRDGNPLDASDYIQAE